MVIGDSGMRQISWGSEESEGRDLEKLWKILQEGKVTEAMNGG